VTLKGLKGGFKVAKNAVQIINKKIIPKSKILCEPHMSKRNLYPTLSKWNQGGFKSKRDSIGQYMNFLQNVDGKNDLDEISVLINISPKLAKNIYYKLKKNNLII
jgi:aminopeptidase-like protein